MTYYDKWVTMYLFEFMRVDCPYIEDILDWYEIAELEIINKFQGN